MQAIVLYITVFVTGATVMVLEIIGARVLAPYVGTSIISWTSLIGIVLASLSVGYYIGGKIADKKPKPEGLFWITYISGLLIAGMAFVKEPFLTLAQRNIDGLIQTSITSTIALFTPQTIILGMALPFATKLSIKKLKETGQKAGNLFAVSTIGSILGTFLAGFYLLPAFGNTNILFILSFLLLSNSFLIYLFLKKKELFIFLAISLAITLTLFLTSKKEINAVADIDTKYQRIIVEKREIESSGRSTLNIVTSPGLSQSSIFLDNPNELTHNYLKFYRLADHFNKNIKNALMLGGGGYTYPRDFLEKHPNATIDVVEIDPKMTDIAKRYFHFEENERLDIYHQDARRFLEEKNTKYDAVYIDVFGSIFAIPYQLTTFEAVEEIHSSLNQNGVVIVNIIASFEGPGSKFLRAEYETYKEVFPQVYLFKIDEGKKEDDKQNISLVALKSDKEFSFKSENEEFDSHLKKRWQDNLKPMPILTDDYAPVDQYLISLY